MGKDRVKHVHRREHRHAAQARGTGRARGHAAWAWMCGVGLPGQYLAQEPPYLSRMPQPTVYCSVGGWKYLACEGRG